MVKHDKQAQPEESGVIRKAHDGRLRVALAYPNSYAVGMSNLALQGFYQLFNQRDDVVCERAFLPEDMSAATVVRTVESGTPLGEMDVVAFTVSYELDYPNVVRMLRGGGIEPFAAQRAAGPLVIAGGATISYNPEPLAPFLDAALIGEGETLVGPLLDALIQAVHGRRDALAALPGIYLPALPIAPVSRAVVGDLDRVILATQVYTTQTEFAEMTLIEVGRGCPYGCRFCVASHVYRPARWRSLDALLPTIEEGLQHRKRVGLIGASVTDHPHIVALCEAILARGGEPSPASMRAEALTDDLLALLARSGARTITLAPETGTEALRATIGKGRLADDALFAAAQRARHAGIRNLKLYFIVGLPGETMDDVAAIPALALRLAQETGMRISLGSSVFVPKPGTPFAREAMISEREARAKLEQIRRGLRGRLPFTHESARWAFWQAVLARGGRELAPALAVIANGPDAPGAWATAFRDLGLIADDYALRAILAEAPVPWAHIAVGRCVLEGAGAHGQGDGD